MQASSLIKFAILYLWAIAFPAGFAHATEITWDGGGADNAWSTPENWSGDSVPGSSDNAIFNSTSTKNCEVSDSRTVTSLTIEGTYTGILSILASGTLTVSGGTCANAGDIDVLSNGVLDTSAATGFTNTGVMSESGTGKILRAATSVALTNSGGTALGLSALGTDLYVTLSDADENLDGTATDTTTALVKSLTTGDEETVTLTETGNATATFRNLTGLPTASGSANPQDGTLQTEGSGFVQVTYADNEDAADTLGPVQIPFAMFWDGGGSDTSWETAANWSSNVVPLTTDDIFFNGTSTKDCLASSSHAAHTVTVTSAYSGTITFGDVALTVTSEFLQDAGTIAWGTAQHDFQGDFTRSGGTSSSSAKFRFGGGGAQAFDPGPGGLTLTNLVCGAGSGNTLNIVGGLTVTGALTQASGDTTYLAATLVLSGASFDNQGTFNVENGAVLNANAATGYLNAGTITETGTGKILRKVQDVFFSTSSGDLVWFVEAGQDVYATIIDEDENLDGT